MSNTKTKAEVMIMEAKIALLREFPFLSFLIMSTVYIENKDVPTMGACVIGGNATVLFNPKFTQKGLVSEEERAFVIAHELLHIFFLHLGRQVDMKYNAKLWNVATDFCINYYLVKMNSSKCVFPTKFKALFDERFAGMSSDEIYHLLLKESDDDVEKALSKFGMAGDGSDKPSPFDEVSKEVLTPDEQAQLKAQLSASLSNSKQMGDGAADLFRALKELIEPKVDWKQVLRDYITKSSKFRYSYQRYNRRSGNVIFPSLTGDFINVVFGVDTSGSMSSIDLAEMVGELSGILDDFESWSLDLISCDTVAHLIGTYNSEEGDDITSIDLNLLGGGGTDMNNMVTMTDEMEEAPNILIIGTDGEIPPLTGSELFPTIVLVTSSGSVNFEQSMIDRVIQVN